MEVVVLERLRRKGMTMAAAETVTGGLLSSRVSMIDPGMETFRGARVGGGASDSARQPHEQRAAAMAAKVRSDFGTDVGIAASAGEVSGTGTSRTAPVSLAVAIGEAQHGETVILPADRNRLRDFSVISLLNLLRRSLPA
jgi:nicotinamide-nucleotide amidase